MYRKDSTGWIKHVDFIILDLICLQVAFVLAYALSGYGANPYQLILYRNMAVFMEVADLVVLFALFVYASGRTTIFQTGIGTEYHYLYATYLSGKRTVETFT